MYKLNKFIFVAMLLGTLFANKNVFAENDDDYSGVYKDLQLIPNRMAELCQKSAEDMVNNPNSLIDCVNTLAIKRNSTDAETAKEGLKELKEIEAEQIIKTMRFATVKGAEIAGYYKEGTKEVNEVNQGAKTNNDADAAAIETNEVLTDVVNNMRDLYVEQLKYLAISNIGEIKKETLDEIAAVNNTDSNETDQSRKNSTSDDGKFTAKSSVVTATVTTKTPASTYSYKGNGVCEYCTEKEESDCRPEDCPDKWDCKQKDCPASRFSDGYVCENIDDNDPEKGTKCEKREGSN